MIPFTRLTRYVRDRKRAVGLIGGGVVALVGVIAVWELRREKEPRGQVRPDALTRSGDMAGMNLSTDGSVQITPAQLTEFGIRFATVEMRPLSGEIRTVGSVVVDETRVAAVTTKFPGFIERLYVDFTGAPVSRGQPLFEIYSPDVLAAQEELLLATRLGSTPTEIPGVPRNSVDLPAAARQRLRLWDVSEAQIDQIERSRTARRTVTMFAPAGGIVLEKNVVAGQAIQAGELLYRIADLSWVWIEAEVREADAAFLTIGARATTESSAYPGRLIPGTVEYVYPMFDEQARTLRARIAIPNPGRMLRPGMYVTVRVSATGRSALTVPNSAIVNTGERSIVFVDYGAGRLVPQLVVVGRVSDQYTEVISGLEPGQRVVTSAQFLLDSESNLAEVMRSMMSQGSGAIESMDIGNMNDRGADMRGMKMPPARR